MALSCAPIRSCLAVLQTPPLNIDVLQSRVGLISLSDVKIPSETHLEFRDLRMEGASEHRMLRPLFKGCLECQDACF
jgi:hypothetical protein